MALVIGVRPNTRLLRNIRKHQYHDIGDFYQHTEAYIRLEKAKEPLQRKKDVREEKDKRVQKEANRNLIPQNEIRSDDEVRPRLITMPHASIATRS